MTRASERLSIVQATARAPIGRARSCRLAERDRCRGAPLRVANRHRAHVLATDPPSSSARFAGRRRHVVRLWRLLHSYKFGAGAARTVQNAKHYPPNVQHQGVFMLDLRALAFLCALTALPFVSACGDDGDDDESTSSGSSSSTGSSVESCVKACTDSASTCGASCSGGECRAGCDSDFDACEQKCSSIR